MNKNVSHLTHSVDTVACLKLQRGVPVKVGEHMDLPYTIQNAKSPQQDTQIQRHRNENKHIGNFLVEI